MIDPINPKDERCIEHFPKWYTTLMNQQKIHGIRRWILWLCAIPASLAIAVLSVTFEKYSFYFLWFKFSLILPAMFVIASVREFRGHKPYFWRMVGSFTTGMIIWTIGIRLLFGDAFSAQS